MSTATVEVIQCALLTQELHQNDDETAPSIYHWGSEHLPGQIGQFRFKNHCSINLLRETWCVTLFLLYISLL